MYKLLTICTVIKTTTLQLISRKTNFCCKSMLERLKNVENLHNHNLIEHERTHMFASDFKVHCFII